MILTLFRATGRISGIFMMLLLLNSAARGQEALSLSLSDAISIGLEQNYQIMISDQELRIAQLNNTPGAAGRYPSIDFRTVQGNSFNNSENRTNPDDRDKLFTNFVTPSLTLNWTIFDGFRVNITKENLEALENLSEGFSAVIVENTVQAIILAYRNLQLQKEKLDVFAELKALSLDRLNYTRTRQQFGTAVTFDVLQANDAYLIDSVNFLQQELNIRNATLLLKLLLALDEQEKIELIDDYSVQLNAYEPDDLLEKMMRNNQTLINQFINQRIFENSTELARSNHYPELFLGSGLDYSNTRLKYDDQPASTSYSFGYYANFTLRFNLYNGGATRRAVQQALINEDIGLIRLAEMQQVLSNQLVNQLDLYNIRKNLLSAAEASLESAGLNLQIAEERFKAGAINSFNYRDIQLNYQNAAIRRLEAIFNLIETETELLRLTGGIIDS